MSDVLTGESILDLPALKARLSLGRSAIYKAVAEGRMPAPVHITLRRVGWLVSEIDRFIAGLAKARVSKSGRAS